MGGQCLHGLRTSGVDAGFCITNCTKKICCKPSPWCTLWICNWFSKDSNRNPAPSRTTCSNAGFCPDGRTGNVICRPGGAPQPYCARRGLPDYYLTGNLDCHENILTSSLPCQD